MPIVVGVGQGALQSIGALQLGGAGFVEYPIVSARRGAGILGGGQIGDIGGGVTPAGRVGGALQVSGKRFQTVFPSVGLRTMAGVQRLPAKTAGFFTAAVSPTGGQRAQAIKLEPAAGIGHHIAQTHSAWRLGKADIMLHELGAGGKTGHGYRLQRRPAPFQIGQQVIHGVE